MSKTSEDLFREIQDEAQRRGRAAYGMWEIGRNSFASSYAKACRGEYVGPRHDQDIPAYAEGYKQGKARRRYWKAQFIKADLEWNKQREKQATATAKRETALAKQDDARREREMQSAARQSIWAIAEVDEKAGDQKTLDPMEAARRLRGVASFDVDTLGGVVPAVKLYLQERNRVKVSMREKKKPRLVQGRIVKP